MLELKGVSKSFPETQTQVLRNIHLHVQPQDCAVIIGPSGGGKSVLLKIIAGLLEPDSGTVHLKTKRIGMLFQKNALFDSFSVLENLLFPLKERRGIVGKEARQIASAMLEAVGLAGNEKLSPDSLSGGMQKRLGIARALIVEPELILYDEPTAGLDPITSRMIAELIGSLRKKQGSTAVIVTNDMQRAYQLGDQIYLLAHHDLIAGGTPVQVKQSSHPEIRQFIYGLKTGPLTSSSASASQEVLDVD